MFGYVSAIYYIIFRFLSNNLNFIYIRCHLKDQTSFQTLEIHKDSLFPKQEFNLGGFGVPPFDSHRLLIWFGRVFHYPWLLSSVGFVLDFFGGFLLKVENCFNIMGELRDGTTITGWQLLLDGKTITKKNRVKVFCNGSIVITMNYLHGAK